MVAFNLFLFERLDCHLDPTTGQIKSLISTFTVFSRPTILLHPKDVSIYLDDIAITVNFTCEASGFPLPVINWLKNNLTVTNGTLVQNGSISSLVLHLQNKEELPGKYRCIAENVLGQAPSKEAALVIRPRAHSSGARKYLCSSLPLTFLTNSYDDCIVLYLFVCLFFCLSVCLSASLFVVMLFCRSVSVCLSVCLSVPLFLSFSFFLFFYRFLALLLTYSQSFVRLDVVSLSVCL